jgi:putative restriction endonuclease
VQDDLLLAVGLELESRVLRPRDPHFRSRVLTLYGYRCAVCDFDARLFQDAIALEAAHIKWHQAGGPPTPENGIAMCSLHHKLFDRGAFTISQDRRIEVSHAVHGGETTEALLIRYHTRELRLPARAEHHPLIEYVTWHRNEVFHGPGR